MKRENLKLKWK